MFVDYAWPIVGHLPQMVRQGVIQHLQQRCAKNSPTLVLRSGFKRIVVPRDPDLIARVLSNQSALFVRDASSTVDLFGDGLLSLHGDVWAERRQLLNPYFKPTIAR